MARDIVLSLYADAMMRALRDLAVLLGVGVLLSGCLRGPITDIEDDGSGGVGSTGGDDSTGLGASDSPTVEGSSGGSSSGSEPEDDCHASYDPCLPIVGDLNCADVIALGAAPVTVVGPDDYGLDADGDGVGCEP